MPNLLSVIFWSYDRNLARVEVVNETDGKPISDSYICHREELGAVKSRLVCQAHTWNGEMRCVGNIFAGAAMQRPDLGVSAGTAEEYRIEQPTTHQVSAP